MNPLIAKLAAQIENLNAQQAAALNAAEAEGVSDEDRAAHLAELDRLQGEKEKAQASRKRAVQFERDQAAHSTSPAGPAAVSRGTLLVIP